MRIQYSADQEAQIRLVHTHAVGVGGGNACIELLPRAFVRLSSTKPYAFRGPDKQDPFFCQFVLKSFGMRFPSTPVSLILIEAEHDQSGLIFDQQFDGT